VLQVLAVARDFLSLAKRRLYNRALQLPQTATMSRLLPTLAMLGLSAALAAQSPLTTTYAGGNGLGAASTIYFDLVVNAPILVNQIDVNLSSAASTAGSIDVLLCPTTYVGNDTNAAAWTLTTTGPVVAQGGGVATPAAITPFNLTPGNYGVAIVFNGVGQNYTNGNGTTTPGSGTNQTYSTAELTLLAGASSGGAPGTAICCNPRVFNGAIHYTVSGSGTVATRTSFGAGCGTKAASFYEHFLTTPSIDLSNTAFQMLNTGSGYVVLPSTTAFVPPSGTATNLNLGDDTTAVVNLSAPFPYPGGTTSLLEVCSNGFVSVASGNGTSYQPAPAGLLARPHASWNVWHDFICNATGNVFVEEVGGIVIITWNGVIGYVGQSAGTVTSTFQLQFHLASGNVDFVFGSMDTISVSTWTGGDGWLVGYSPNGVSRDPGSVDLSAVLPATIALGGADLNPLAMTSSNRPLAGTNITWDISNIPAGAPFGAILLGFTQFNPGIDLTSIGMEGCSQYTDGSVSTIFLTGGNTSVSQPFSVPNFVGVQFFAQSAIFAPQANLTSLGFTSSQGLALTIGNL
jgi:hypothetical protein